MEGLEGGADHYLVKPFSGRELLAYPLGEVALAAGFVDQAHLTNMFRSAVGVTPGHHVRLCCATA